MDYYHQSRENAAHSIGFIEGRIAMYNEMMEIITTMHTTNDLKWNYSNRTLQEIENRIFSEINL